MTKQNKNDFRGEDHGTRDTKETATDKALKNYSALAEESIEAARGMAVLDMIHEQARQQRARHVAERSDRETLEDEIANGIEDYYSERPAGEGTKITVDTIESKSVKVKVSHELGSLATRQ